MDIQEDTGNLKNTAMSVQAHTNCKGVHQAVRDTLDVLNGKWKLAILSMLLERPWRFKELQREIGISPRVLSKELKEMETDLLITRTVCDTKPVTVEYASTQHSRTLIDVIVAMQAWGNLHYETVVGRKRSSIIDQASRTADFMV